MPRSLAARPGKITDMTNETTNDLITEWGATRGEAVPQEAIDDLNNADYDADYVLAQDKDVDLSASGPHQVTETDLIKNPQWIEASRRLMPLFSGTLLGSDDGDLSNEEAAQWGLEFMGWFNFNLPSMGFSVNKIQKAPGDQKLALFYLMRIYDDKQIDWNGTKRFFKGMVADPTTYVGLGTFGFGAFLGASAKQATKTGIVAALKAGLPTTALAAIEAGAFTSFDDAMRQEVAIEAGAQEGFKVGQNVGATAVGTGIGGLLGSGFSLVPEVVRNVFRSNRPTE